MSKIIAIWGSPNSGKTALSVKLARNIYEKTKQVVLVLHTDFTTPVLPVLFPNCKACDIYSVGAALSKTEITQSEILKCVVSPKGIDDLGFLGFKDGENKYTYPKFDEIRSVLLIVLMGSLADYIIVDCTSDSDNILSLVALSQADVVIKLSTPDLKSMSFYSSQVTLYTDQKYRQNEHIQGIQVLDNDIFLPTEEVKVHFKDVKFELPYCKEIKQQMLDGSMLDKTTSKRYSKVLNAITERAIKIEKNV